MIAPPRQQRQAIVQWLEERTGLPSAMEHFLMEDIPASAGWPQVFGSARANLEVATA